MDRGSLSAFAAISYMGRGVSIRLLKIAAERQRAQQGLKRNEARMAEKNMNGTKSSVYGN